MGLVAGFGLVLSPVIFMAVAMLRGMLPARRARRVVLPVAGTLIGWTMAALVLAITGAEASTQTAALTLMAGFFGFGSAAGLNAQQRESGREDGRG